MSTWKDVQHYYPQENANNNNNNMSAWMWRNGNSYTISGRNVNTAAALKNNVAVHLNVKYRITM